MSQDSLAYRRTSFTLQTGAQFDQDWPSFTFAASVDIYLLKGLTVGPGFGYDSYSTMQAIPMFGTLKYDFGTLKKESLKKNYLFLQHSYGWGKPWLNDNLRDDEYGFVGSEGGRFINFQVGYRISYDKVNVSFLLGIKNQRGFLNYKYPQYQYWDGTTSSWYSPSNTKTIKREIRSASITMAISWK